MDSSSPAPRPWSSGQSTLKLAQHLPPPVAVAYHKLQQEPSSAFRKDLTIACVDACLRTLLAFLLADYLSPGRAPDRAVEALLPQLAKSQMGSLVQLVRALVKALGKGNEVFLADAHGWYFDARGGPTPVARSLEEFTGDRNRLTHGVPTIAAVQAFQGRNEDGLERLIHSLAWLQKYRLVHQKHLQNHDDLYSGHLQFLSGPTDFQRSEPARWAPRLTTDWVYAVHPSGSPLLALYPWMHIVRDRVCLFKDAQNLRHLRLIHERDGSEEHLAPVLQRHEVSAEDWLSRARTCHDARLDNEAARSHLSHPEYFDTLPVGHEVGSYKIVGILGRGAWGVVYEVESVVTGRRHALKLLLPWRAANPRYAQRHEREGHRQASIRDPNVVPVDDFVKLPNGTVALRMPVFRGGTLRERVRPEGDPNIVSLTRGMARGLRALHSAGLVHRDVKPDNFLLTDDGQVLLADLGHALRDGDEQLSSSGTIAGTADYWSPEQESGASVAEPSDIYSLAIVATELATGRPARAVRADGPGVGVAGPLGALLVRMGRRVPRERPTAAEVVGELDRLVEEDAKRVGRAADAVEARADPDRSAGSPPAPNGVEGAKPRHRAMKMARKEAERKAVSTRKANKAERRAAEAARAAAEREERAAAAQAARVEAARIEKRLAEASGRLTQDGPTRLVQEAELLAAHGEFQAAADRYGQALDLDPYHLVARLGRGRCHLELGDYPTAISDFQRAEDDAPDSPLPQVAIGDLYVSRKEYLRGIEAYDRAIAIDGAHAMAHFRRGIARFYRNEYASAREDLERAATLDPSLQSAREQARRAAARLRAAAETDATAPSAPPSDDGSRASSLMLGFLALLGCVVVLVVLGWASLM